MNFDSWLDLMNTTAQMLLGDVGSNSCIGGTTIGYDGYVGFACYNFQGPSVGDNSCNDYAACYQFVGGYYTGSIGSDSCNGRYACSWTETRDTGNKSCNGYYACAYSVRE